MQPFPSLDHQRFIMMSNQLLMFYCFCSASCPDGYAKNMENSVCEDINECDTGDANCDINSQACLNTIGSFKCLDILVNERVNHCEDGFRYQARIDQCVGRLSLF